MTNATHTCYLCDTAEATAMKTETETEWLDDEEGTEIRVPVMRPICSPCNERWFDGTEDVPQLFPLS